MHWATRPKRGKSVRNFIFQYEDSLLKIFCSAMKVGVPVVPGTPGAVASYEEADEFIKEYGFPGKF